jgi:hypothetical protein
MSKVREIMTGGAECALTSDTLVGAAQKTVTVGSLCPTVEIVTIGADDSLDEALVEAISRLPANG